MITWDSDDACDAKWIGDGQCDDLCQTLECSHDGGDCELVCPGICMAVGIGWMRFSPALDQWQWEHHGFCATHWNNEIALAGEFEGSDNCEGTLQSLDFNKDGSLNFREYVAFVSRISFGFEDSRALQINCSSCLAITGAPPEAYNP